MACEIDFMFEHPYLFTIIMAIFMPCAVILGIVLYRSIELILSKGDDNQ